jgi:hypothetical protein
MRMRGLIRHRRLRRAAGAALVILGGVLMWLAAEALTGAILMAAGIGLEIAGIALEHRAGAPKEDRDAMER